MAYVTPWKYSTGTYSRGRLDEAGENARQEVATNEDREILNNWRGAHLYVINTFQANLRGRRKRLGANITIAQRLKRMPTITDKLRRQPKMAMSRMHDIAGCRLIFENIDELSDFRTRVLKTRAKHELLSGEDKYNYIARPKSSGYRGVHDVYKYVADRATGAEWDGLRIEIQYRTKVQHAWATAVEISDIVHSSRVKFSQGAENIEEFFTLCSELLARRWEARTGPLPDASETHLLSRIAEIDQEHRLLQSLTSASSAQTFQIARSFRLFILINIFEGAEKGNTKVIPLADSEVALSRYRQLEDEYAGTADVVLVGAQENDALKLAYTNYFSDAKIFLELLASARHPVRASQPVVSKKRLPLSD